MPDLLFVVLVFLCASVVHAIAGFGAGLVAMSLLVMQWPVARAVGVCSVCTLLLNFWMAWQLRRDINWSELGPMVLATLIGVPLGVTALHSLPEEWIIGGLGVLLILHSTRGLLLGDAAVSQVGRAWGFLAGLFGGLLGGAFNTSGPPVIIYGTARGWEKDRFRATLQIYFIVTGVLAVVLYVGTGVVSMTSLPWSVLAIPVMAIGAAIGQRLVARISAARFRILVFVGLEVTGAYYIWRVIF